MAAGTEFSPPFTVLEGSYSKDSVPGKRDEISENSDNLKQMTNGKPPRHLSVVRHFISSDAEVAASDLVSYLYQPSFLHINFFHSLIG